ncbi:hypothetical protein AMTR_s00099p00091790 [Amborella trichopoda]|uniref:Response regulatory domain-containing protein n=1 Tax=Amborella trichopoda TaxID=13333 RepID=W1NYG4_AMBTC|nr:hypothetical protein AMTR_s00099p00091790 [Amborella trichopoda]
MGGQKRQRDGEEGEGEGEGEGGEEEKEAEERGGFHALVVDDCPIDRKIVERLLKTGFSKVTAVDSGRRALKVLGFSEHNHESPPGPPRPDGLESSLGPDHPDLGYLFPDQPSRPE